MDMFSGRELLIATMHQKEKVLAPILETKLGVTCYANTTINTDVLGTFSGEIERTDTPLATAKRKCLLGMEEAGCDLAVSSEGSFSPHPAIPLLTCNEEILFFYDKKNKIEISVREISLETNFAQQKVSTWEELKEFAERVLFPSHGLIIKDDKDIVLEKGVNNWMQLEALFNQSKKNLPYLTVETDMRAHMNPTRMSVIEKAGWKLVEAILSTCPKCSYPGFTVQRMVPGLPCQNCHLPTKSILKQIKVCRQCGSEQEEMFPNGRPEEDAMYCDFCNP